MNAKKLITAAAIFAATGSAFAAEWVDFSDFKSTRTRAEVMAELQADQGRTAANTEYVEPAAGFASTRTRAQVMAELRQSQADGSYAVLHQEYQGQFPGLDNGDNRVRLAGDAGAARSN